MVSKMSRTIKKNVQTQKLFYFTMKNFEIFQKYNFSS